MDNGNGNFEPIDDFKFQEQIKKPHPLVFKIGEILEIRGSRFRVENVKKNKLTLKLLKFLKK